MRDGKPVPKEMTEEQRREADELAKGPKGGKAKEAPKKGAKEEEQSPEEHERMEKEREEREEIERKATEEWNKLDEETKHIRTNEDIFKLPCIKMSNVPIIKKIEELQAKLNAVSEEDTATRE
jgi:hypothetical protein